MTAAQSQLVLINSVGPGPETILGPGASNRPPVAADANCHGSTGPSKRDAAAPANPTTSTASANTDPAAITAPAEESNS